MRIRIYIFPSFLYIYLYHWIAICRESFEENGNYYLWETMYKRQYICREKERGYLKPLWNSKSFLVLVFFYLHYPVLRDPFCKVKEALKCHTCFNLRMWREFWMALLFLWAKPINYYPNPFLLWCQTRRSAKMLDLSGVYWVSVMKKILVPATRVISQSYSQQVRSRKLLGF